MTTFTKEKIFNITLNKLGVSAVVQDINENNPRTTVLLNNYDLAFEQVAKSFDWNFLNFIKELTPVTDGSSTGEYLYAYDYPNDCIAARYIIDNSGGKYKKFDISTDTQGRRIVLCNITPAKLIYTRKPQTAIPETFVTSEFVEALSSYLAYLTAEAITGNTQKKNMNYQAFQFALAHAKAMSANESSYFDEDEKTYIDYRN